MRIIQTLVYWLMIAATILVMGQVYSLIFLDGKDRLASSVFALFCGMPILMFRRGMGGHSLHGWLRRLPTLAYNGVNLVINFLLVNGGFLLGAMVLRATGVIEGDWRQPALMPANVFFYSLAASGLVVFILEVRELLGRRVFLSLLTGRYRNPVQEQRVFLFIDLVDSVSYAERHGDARALQLLGAIFAMMDRPVRDTGGAVDDYIGDAALVTWPLEQGLRDGNCIRCVFAILDDIERHRGQWERQHGRVPRLRAALHAGTVVTGEVGLDHRKIAYFGDTVNTAARLEQLAKAVGADVVMSGELAAQVVLPKGIRATPLGPHPIKGREQPVELYGLGRLN